MNWISVEDRLPDIDDAMLVYHTVKVNESVSVRRWTVGYAYDDNQFLDLDGCQLECVTHWCEITEPSE